MIALLVAEVLRLWERQKRGSTHFLQEAGGCKVLGNVRRLVVHVLDFFRRFAEHRLRALAVRVLVPPALRRRVVVTAADERTWAASGGVPTAPRRLIRRLR